MAGIVKRKKTWMAIFYLNGKKMIRTTGVKIKQQGYTARQLENLARQQADKIEALARGDAMLDKQIDALRAASEAAGSGARIPSAHDYFIAFKPEGGHQNISNAKRAHNLFLTHLGADAAKRLDRITRDMCQRFIDDQSKTMSAGTVKKFRAHLSCVFNTAIRDGLLTRSPWAGVKLPKVDTVHHEPFTREQIRTLFTKLPPLWQDMVKFCIYSGGQRLGDVATMKWSCIDLQNGIIRFSSNKTGLKIENPILPPLLNRLKEIKAAAGEREEYVFPHMAYTYKTGRGHLSTEFTTLLKSLSMYRQTAPPEGGRKRKGVLTSFHSLRSFMVSSLNNIGIPSRLVKAIVGHADNSDVEGEYYYHASLSEKTLAFQSFDKWLMADTEEACPWLNRPDYRKQA